MDKKDKKIILQKRVYLHAQRRQEIKEPYPNNNWRDWITQSVLTEQQVKVNYNFNKKDYEFYPEFKTESDSKTARSITGWNGLRKMFPFVDDDYNVECLVTIIVPKNDVCNIDENFVIDEYKQDNELYNFHTEGTFFITETGHGIMMSKEKNMLFWETDDGYVKWDVGDRSNGASIYDDHPLYDMIPVPYNNDEHGECIPYEAKVIVDACI